MSTNYPKGLYFRFGRLAPIRYLLRCYTFFYLHKVCKNTGNTLIIFYKGCDTLQATHPDILYDAETQRYVMTVSDYPFGNEHDENSYVFESADGIEFHNLMQGPVEAYTGHGDSHYSDGEIIKDDSGYHVYCRLCLRDDEQNDVIFSKTSRDLKHWTADGELIRCDRDGMLSPAIIQMASCYRMYFVKIVGSGSVLYETECPDYKFAEWKQHCRKIQIENMPAGCMLWHINVSKGENGKLHALLTLSTGLGGANASLYYAEGFADSDVFTIKNKVDCGIAEKYIKKVYRAALVKVENDWMIYMSMCTKNDCWFVVRRPFVIEGE